MGVDCQVKIPGSKSRVVEIRLKTPETAREDATDSDTERNKSCFSSASARSLFTASKTFSGLYALLLVSVYVSLTANKLVSSPMYHPKIEVSWIMLYLYLVSSVFLLYILLYLSQPPHSYAHIRSHGSAFLRQGALIFGIGSFLYHSLEFTTYFIIDLHPHCLDVLNTVNSFLSIIFVILQSTTIIIYPRLNIHQGSGLPHIGLMHLLATNMIVWARTVIKESVHEYHVAEERLEHHVLHIVHAVNTSDILEHITEHADNDEHRILKRSVEDVTSPEKCRDMFHDDDFVTSILEATSPFLYAFIIEFSLVGGTVFFNTWNNVTLVRWHEAKENNPKHAVQKPNLSGALLRINWSNSLIGSICGSFILLLVIFDLMAFFSVDYEDDVIFEYIGKVLDCTINSCGIIAVLIGIAKIQKLPDKSNSSENSVDLFLLDFSIFFVYIYGTLTASVGVFSTDERIPGSLHIFNGLLDITSASLQVVFIHQLIEKTISVGKEKLMGRQFVTFLCFLNFAVWLFNTFELQKSKASLVEAKFYGPLVWVWLQRITLPVCIFFRFHSTVLLIDCWKNSYRLEPIAHLIENINNMSIS